MDIKSPTFRKKALVVDDLKHQRDFISDIVQSLGCEVLRSHSSDDAERILKENDGIELVAVDLGLPPLGDKPDIGLALIKKLREQQQQLIIVVLSAMLPDASMVRECVKLRASFIYLRQTSEEERIKAAIQFALEQYVIFSPLPAELLPFTLPREDDPFDQAEWSILENIATTGNTYKAIGQKLGYSEEGIKDFAKRIYDVLENRNEISKRERVELVRWFSDNHRNYGH